MSVLATAGLLLALAPADSQSTRLVGLARVWGQNDPSLESAPNLQLEICGRFTEATRFERVVLDLRSPTGRRPGWSVQNAIVKCASRVLSKDVTLAPARFLTHGFYMMQSVTGGAVQEGDSPAAGLMVKTFEVDEELSIAVRYGERLRPDGGAGFVADAVVPADSADAARQKALALLKGSRHGAAVPGPVSAPFAYGAFVENDYSETPYPDRPHRLLALFRLYNAIELTVSELATRMQDSHVTLASPVLDDYFGTHRPAVRVDLVEELTVIDGRTRPAKQTADGTGSPGPSFWLRVRGLAAARGDGSRRRLRDDPEHIGNGLRHARLPR